MHFATSNHALAVFVALLAMYKQQTLMFRFIDLSTRIWETSLTRDDMDGTSSSLTAFVLFLLLFGLEAQACL
jgi:hypothetical protein